MPEMIPGARAPQATLAPNRLANGLLEPSNAAPGSAIQILRISISRDRRKEEVSLRELISHFDCGDNERYQVHVALPEPWLVPLWGLLLLVWWVSSLKTILRS